MKTSDSTHNLRAGLTLAMLVAFASGAQSADLPKLKDIYKDYFAVGSALNRSQVSGGGGRRNPEQTAKEVALVKEQFNQIVSENDMKWESIHPRQGADGFNFGPADALVEFGEKNNMMVVGHTLVWHSQTPTWVFQGTAPAPDAAAVPATATPAPATPAATPAATPGANAGGPPGGRGPGFGGGGGRGAFTGPRATREELLQRMREHIHAVVGRYKGKVKVWDVVNEALSDGGPEPVLRRSLWSEIIGPDFIEKAFEYAHEADPQAILRYNDYGLENPVKRRKLITVIKGLLEKKVPVMAIGSQAHINVSTTFETMDQALTEIATLGLPIHITELDVNSAAGGQRSTGADIAGNASTTQGGLVDDANKKLADAYAGIFRAFVKHRDSVKVVTFWGVNDAVSWRASGKPLLFDGNNDPKPAFEAVIRVVTGESPKTQ
jgi:endo-1,4-beta-xylanase